MCGVAGFYRKNSYDSVMAERDLADLTSMLVNRGPDGQDYWIETDSSVAFSHTRLAIQGLGSQGTQPKISSSGRYVLTFNGEIYNHLPLRSALPLDVMNRLRQFSSDAVTLIELIEHFGIRQVVPKLRGMFAFAVYDRNERRLTLVRDSYGEKPLYVFNPPSGGETVYFSSSIKSFRNLNGFTGIHDEVGLEQYRNFGMTISPTTFFKNVRSVKPGTIQEYTMTGCKNSHSGGISEKTFTYIAESEDPIHPKSQIDTESHLTDLVHEAIVEACISDVDVGCFLSGGVDSTIVAAIASDALGYPLKSFSIGFPNTPHDESHYARSVASQLNLEHHEINFSAREFGEYADKCFDAYDEPFSDMSCIPTLAMAEFSSKKVKLVLTGDGGDEFFAGYDRHVTLPKIFKLLSFMPSPVRKLISRTLDLCTPNQLAVYYRFMQLGRFSSSADYGEFLRKFEKIRRFIDTEPSVEALYLTNLIKTKMSYRSDAQKSPLNLLNLPTCPWSENEAMNDMDPVAKILNLDQRIYLPNDIFRKSDASTMRFGLESRSPFANPLITNFANNLSTSEKIIKKESKHLLRKIARTKVSAALIDRPKKGFGVPLDRWMRNELKGWCYDHLMTAAANEDLFEKKLIVSAWNQHQRRELNNSEFLWLIISYQCWEKNEFI